MRPQDDLAPARGITVGAVLGGALFAAAAMLLIHLWYAVFGP